MSVLVQTIGTRTDPPDTGTTCSRTNAPVRMHVLLLEGRETTPVYKFFLLDVSARILVQLTDALSCCFSREGNSEGVGQVLQLVRCDCLAAIVVHCQAIPSGTRPDSIPPQGAGRNRVIPDHVGHVLRSNSLTVSADLF